jgi:putative transposase
VPPLRIVPVLADRGECIACESSFYRALNAESLLIERGRAKVPTVNQLALPHRNQAKYGVGTSHAVRSHVAGQPFHLYMIEDIYSRKIVGADVYDSETGELASALLQRVTRLEKFSSAGLVLHSDNGSPMKSFTMRAKMYDLGIIASHSRPRVSNDNPYSKSLFRTLKYCPSWPKHGFATIAEARKWVGRFVACYNSEHRHSKIKFVTPNQRDYGLDTEILQTRKELHELKKSENASRWSGSTRNWEPITKVHLNPEKIHQAA